MKNFNHMYTKLYPNEPDLISREKYGRRKWKILRMMTKSQIISDYKDNKYFGNQINKTMTKEEILKVLKKYSGFI